MNIASYFLILYTIILNTINSGEALKLIQDEELMNLIRAEPYVITLFSTKQNCETCENFENALNSLKEEFANLFNGQTVKVVNSQLTRLYSPTKEPLLVFFRYGIPLLYDDLVSEELILHTFLNNKDPTVKELNDQTFEHLTQVATGATTGDWFIMFYTPDCIDCMRLQARWETVGAKLKTKMNIARINKAVEGAATAARFGVNQVPSFILFRHGKMYRYQIQKYDVASFISFAQEWYKNLKPEKVPLPVTPFDKLIDNIIISVHENTSFLQISSLLLIFGVVAIILLKYRKRISHTKAVNEQLDKDK